jgi:hemoglobin-like flavoprotein
MMTQQDKHLIRESFEALKGEAGAVASLFYGRLFEREPALRSLFRGDIDEQGAKLMSMIAIAVASLDKLETLAAPLRTLGEKHTGYGVQPSHYAVVEDALAWTLGQTLNTDPDALEIQAWRRLVQIVSVAMEPSLARQEAMIL